MRTVHHILIYVLDVNNDGVVDWEDFSCALEVRKSTLISGKNQMFLTTCIALNYYVSERLKAFHAFAVGKVPHCIGNRVR